MRSRGSEWLRFPRHPQRLLEPERFRFLNEERQLSFPGGWNEAGVDKLWLYNLHYFEDLLAEGAEDRREWHRDLIDRWVRDNPPFEGNGWEPYPISVRVGYWIKWALAGNALEQHWRRSLALQVEYLSRRLEWHLLGNHLFENAKALVLAGLFFDGPRADRWRGRGLRILDRQLDEQILTDGGHFERSPMYHALVLEGLLDLIQISEHYAMDTDQVPDWRRRAEDMIAWLRVMSCPDGQIAFFNDAAVDVALPPPVIADYAKRLGVETPEPATDEGIELLENSGYVRAARGPMVAVLDAAPVGPDYQPGHAHADTLSFELSVFGQRVLVNSGTSVYGLGDERLRQRGTSAHNTVVVDGRDSSEVWSAFRVGRRARPRDVSIRGTGEVWHVQASHDGYRRLAGGAVHRRAWLLETGRLVVEDFVAGSFDSAVGLFHFHPAVTLSFAGSKGEASWTGGRLSFVIEQGSGVLRASTYHPAFGVSIDGQCLEVELDGGSSRIIFEA